jgi:hypothetical protein
MGAKREMIDSHLDAMDLLVATEMEKRSDRGGFGQNLCTILMQDIP